MIPYRFDLFDLFKLSKNAIDIPYNYEPKHLYYEKHWHFDPEAFEIKDETDINGWFQSYKYFEHCEDKLRKELRIKDVILEKAYKHFTKLNIEKEALIISMRLTDAYKAEKNYNTANIEYYKTALREFNLNNYDIILISDDIKQCSQIIKSVNSNIKPKSFNEKDPLITLGFYSLCDHYIIPNSTFAWWGAWLGNNEDKKVIVPKQWFNADVNFSTLSPKNWKKL